MSVREDGDGLVETFRFLVFGPGPQIHGADAPWWSEWRPASGAASVSLPCDETPRFAIGLGGLTHAG